MYLKMLTQPVRDGEMYARYITKFSLLNTNKAVCKLVSMYYRKFDLDDDLAGLSHTSYLSGQAFIKILKPFGREFKMVAMSN